MISREEWGAVPPKWTGPVNGSAGVFIHYNGPAVSAPVYAGEPEAVKAYLRAIQRFHMVSNGWPDIAYSFAVDTGGRAYSLRGWGRNQAATVGWNHRSHSILLILGVGQAPTERQWAAVRELVAEHNLKYGPGFVRGHREAPNSTSCPGDIVIADLKAGKGDPKPVRPEPVPEPEGEEIMHLIVKDPRPGHSIWHVAGNARYRLATPDEVNALRFFGVKYVEVNANDPAAVNGILSLLRACKDLGRPRGT